MSALGYVAGPHGVHLAPALEARVRALRVRTRRAVTSALSGAWRSTFRGAGIEFEEVRPYQIGDDVRTIDWNVTARTGQPYVKSFLEERQLTLHFAVDLSRSMLCGTRRADKRELALEFVALLSEVALRSADQVGLSLFGSGPLLFLPPRKEHEHVLRVLRELYAAPAADGPADLVAALQQQGRLLKRRGVIFVLSDFLDPRAAWSEALAALNRRHDVVAVRLIDPLEQELPPIGLLELVDPESGRRVAIDAASRAVREDWKRAASAQRQQVLDGVARAGVELLEISTADNVADSLQRFFLRRARPGGRVGVGA